MAKGTSVTTKKDAGLPAELMDELVADGQQYQETMSKDDMSIPFLQILQSLSPQVIKGKPEFIKGAEPSMLFNTVTKELVATRDDDDNQIWPSLQILPIYYKRSFIEWVPRNKGGGFVKEYDVATGLTGVTQRNEQNLDIIQQNSPIGKPGNQLNDTHTHFVFVIREDGSFSPVVLTMTSTQLKPSKDWNALIAEVALPNGAKPPRFFATWKVSTRMRTNDQGSWYVWEFQRAGAVTDFPNGKDIYHEAKKFRDGVVAGEQTVDYSKMEGEANPAAESTEDEEMPF